MKTTNRLEINWLICASHVCKCW